MNVYKDMRKKRRLRAEKEIQDAYRNLDQMLGQIYRIKFLIRRKL